MDEKFRSILKQNRLSYTKQRASVFRVLLTAPHALSMNELLEKCDSVDRVSVYRIVDQFESIGVVHKIQIGWKYKLELGDVFKEHHHHLGCISCGDSVDINEPHELDQFIARIAQKHSYEITQHTLELRGICSHCKSMQ